MMWLLVAIVALLACCVLYACDRPGYRRRLQDREYKGPERRVDMKAVDSFDHPVFRRPRCATCDKLKLNACPPEGHSTDPPESYRDNNERHI